MGQAVDVFGAQETLLVVRPALAIVGVLSLLASPTRAGCRKGQANFVRALRRQSPVWPGARQPRSRCNRAASPPQGTHIPTPLHRDARRAARSHLRPPGTTGQRTFRAAALLRG